jgi:hypothetical protein
LILEYNGNQVRYIREENNFTNLADDIIGTWYDITDISNRGYICFKKDGTGRYKYPITETSLSSIADFSSWRVEGNYVIAKKINTSNTYKHFKVSFINDNYIGINGVVKVPL